MTEEQRKLAADNYDTIDTFMSIHKLSYQAVEDWHGILSYALCQAAIHFDENRGVSFRTLSYVYMKNAYGHALMHVYTQKKYAKWVCSLDKPFKDAWNHDDEGKSFYDLIPAAEDVVDKAIAMDIQEAYQKALNKCNEKVQSFARDYFDYGFTMDEIGKRHGGLSRQAVSYQLIKFVRILKRCFGKESLLNEKESNLW